MAIKTDILSRLWIVFLLFVTLAMAIVVKAGMVMGNANGYKSKQTLTKIDTIYGMRGDILSEEGHLLSTSLPIFSAYLDLNVPSLTNKIFNKHIDSLSLELSNVFQDRNQQEFKQFLIKTRNSGNRYKLLKRDLTYQQMKVLRELPLFNKGRNKGGLIIECENTRQQPFGLLAQRTIGYTKDNQKYVGIEGAFNQALIGEERPIAKYLGPGSNWIPVIDAAGMPERGKDVKTTLNLHLQDIAEEALNKALVQHNANHGCAIVMEVSTGKIKAIANLMQSNGTCHEGYNFAIGESTEPGSTFKLASMLALLQNDKFELDSLVYVGNGERKFHDRKMKDSSPPKKSYYTLKEVFKYSSNVGIAKLIDEAFGKEPIKFVESINDLGLLQNTQIEIPGEVAPTILHPNTDAWSGVSLPWLATGYGVMLTPLQQLCFYNAIANKGAYMKPYIVEDIIENGRVVEHIKPHKLKQICSNELSEIAITALTDVVNEGGTAKNIKLNNLTLAGKTGTAQIASAKKGYKQKIYQASFAGFFPAEKPQYSCIVVINEPTNGAYYGSSVAAPVFKEIAEKYFVHRHNKTQEIEHVLIAESKPTCTVTNTDDLVALFNEFEVDYSKRATSNYTIAMDDHGTFTLANRIFREGEVPNVRGMGLKDALYVLENKGIKVKFKGDGVVYKQSIKAGERYSKGQTIYLDLS